MEGQDGSDRVGRWDVGRLSSLKHLLLATSLAHSPTSTLQAPASCILGYQRGIGPKSKDEPVDAECTPGLNT